MMMDERPDKNANDDGDPTNDAETKAADEAGTTQIAGSGDTRRPLDGSGDTR